MCTYIGYIRQGGGGGLRAFFGYEFNKVAVKKLKKLLQATQKKISIKFQPGLQRLKGN